MKMEKELWLDDLVLQVITRKDKSLVVFPHQRVLDFQTYPRDQESTKIRFVVYMKTPRRREEMEWERFCTKAKSIIGEKNLISHRTRQIDDRSAISGLQAFWKPNGRISQNW
jgi:hypothetical protein